MKETVLAIVALLAIFSLAEGATITVTGSYTQPVSESDLSAGAGSALNSTYTSTTSAVTIDIGGVVSNNQFRVSVRKLDTSWPAGVTLYVRRTGDGTGSGSISGGTTYQQVTNADMAFFNGRRNRTGVTVQFQITSVSLSVDPASYLTTVVFTVQ